MTDQELDDLEADLRGGTRSTYALIAEAANAIAELRKKNAGLVGALEKIALGDGHYGQQAGEYKKIARTALKGKETP